MMCRNFAICATVTCMMGLLTIVPGKSADSTYQGTVAKWRADYESSLKSDDGWLTVSGLFWLHEGENHFGTDPLTDIVLHATYVPADAGDFMLQDGKIVVHVKPGVKMSMNDQPVTTTELKPDSRTDRLRIGDITLYVHASGERYAIRLKDKNSQIRKSFTGLHWFPVDESYRVTARYVPYEKPKPIVIQNILGDSGTDMLSGYVVFSLRGQEYRLEAEQDERGELSFVFRDLTSGKETYAASRFLDTDAPRNGSVVLDFNEAYNPPCAYNPYTTCPLPPPGNRLRTEIRAGEQIYKHE
jgi:uncharacterized protein (DUF1684 family)